ncbi:hypothetical protein, partial [Lonsdalea quercina]|uniref:hypothetical protein n=1 Tax=Lonsdalea quercina TaxID=71657 RepID=UPI003974C39C
KARSAAVNPSLTAIFQEKARTHVWAFLYAEIPLREGENPLQGSTKRQRRFAWPSGHPQGKARSAAVNPSLSAVSNDRHLHRRGFKSGKKKPLTQVRGFQQ